jgi:cell division septation protein DedD
MAKRSGEPEKKSAGRVPAVIPGRSATLLLLLLLINITPLYSQEGDPYYEISVTLSIPRTGTTELEALIAGEELYLAISDLFTFLKIKNDLSPDLESVSGFFISPDAPYSVTRMPARIEYGGRIFIPEEGDLLRTDYNLYMKSDLFDEIFGLEIAFNFRTLSATLESRQELPLIREMRLEEMRRNLSNLRGEFTADTTIDRTYPLFKTGMADWSAVVTEEINGSATGRFNLSLGAMIAGGEATASLNYNTRDPLSEKQQYYHWRFVNNDFSPLRQVAAGKIRTGTISTLYNPVVGIQLTNTPTTYRRSYGTYNLSDRTEPGWVVELYINNVLVDYVTADASGFFTFEVPLVYGNTNVNLKFYGPWGEERTREQNITIPYNYLPVNTLEYTVSAGVVEDSEWSRFSRAAVNYGVSRRLTIGGGVEYLSSLSNPVIPFASASASITNNLLLSAEYAHGVKTTGNLSFRLPASLQLDLKYTLYDREQEAISFNYLEERKATLSLPVRVGKFSSYQRLSLYQIILPNSEYTTGEWLFSGRLFGVNTNLTTYAIIIGDTDPTIYSNLAAAFRLPAGFTLMPQLQYSFTGSEFLSGKVKVEKRIMNHTYMNFSWEQNNNTGINLFELGVRFDFSFAQTGASVWRSGKQTTMTQYARGSLIHDAGTGWLGADNRTNVGRGGITVIPFIDMNNNGVKEKGEPAAYGLNMRTSGGRVLRNESDTTIRIVGLEPYTTCFIELDNGGFDNVAWRLPFKSISVEADPNIMKSIWVPVTIAGEASGTVTAERGGIVEGMERILVEFRDMEGNRITRVLTEYDGYYSFFGLNPGNYTVAIDSAQLAALEMVAEPASIPFAIKADIDGDIVGGLNFTLKPVAVTEEISVADTAATGQVVVPVSVKDSTFITIHEVVEELITISEDSWAIQLGAFRNREYAEIFRERIQSLVGKNVQIVVEDGFYKTRILDIKERNEVDALIDILTAAGHTELWVIRLKAMQQQRVLTERTDSTLQVTERVTGYEELPEVTPDMSIQLGAFRNSSYALALQNRLRAAINQEVVIVEEDGYHKVRVTGFKSLEEMEAAIPALGLLGMRDIWILPVQQPEQTEREADTLPVVTDTLPVIPVVTERDSVVVDADTIPDPPRVAIQAGIFIRRNEAQRAQRRISEHLNREVLVIERWDRYYVIIPGFYTREETYSFYPELAGLGYSQIMIIENWESP